MPKILEIEKPGYGRYMFVGTGETRQRLWVPDWARWMAQSKDGTWCWYSHHPVAGNEYWWSQEGFREFAYMSLIPRNDWQSMIYKVQ